MKFELLQGKYKSINPFIWNNIPNFAIVTGKNGSGKSQLLELINFHFSATDQKRSTAQRNPSDSFHNVITNSNITLDSKEVIHISSLQQLKNLNSSSNNNLSQVIGNIHQQINKTSNKPEYEELARLIEDSIGKVKSEINRNDIQNHLPVDYYDYINKIQIHEGLNEAIQIYHCKNAELRDQGLSVEEIRKSIGNPPWEIINRMLARIDFPYEIKQPQTYYGDYSLELISKSTPNLKINFSDLSSGEKTIFALSMWMFNTQREKRIPKLMLLDEPDAHLHPSTLKHFINILQKELVEKNNIKVIMTSHSPSTIALASLDSLYEMRKDGTTITPIKSKEYAISMLTDGIVIVKPNTKYVLVEDKNDAIFYSNIFDILLRNEILSRDIPVVFIPSSTPSTQSTGGKTVVKKWVEKFTINGEESLIQGIIDLDNDSQFKDENCANTSLHTLNRYSLENYLLDPIMVYASMLHRNDFFNIEGINLLHQNEHELSKLNNESLQLISDKVVSIIEPLLENLKPHEKEKIKIIINSNIIITYPSWLINRKGHELFSVFEKKFKKAITYDNLNNAIIRHEFVPDDLTSMLKRIQNNNA